MVIEAVLWDMDGTLIDSEPIHEAALIETLTAQGLETPKNLNEEVIGLSAVRIHQLLTKRFGLNQSYSDWCVARQLNYLRRAPSLKARDGAIELFRELKSLRVKQAIVSNSDRMIVMENMHALGLDSPDLVTISKNDIREGKPSPEGYLRASWLLEVSPSKSLVIEDSVTGALAGISAGMVTAYIPQNRFFKSPTKAKEFKDFNELRNFLEFSDLKKGM
jgi:HAD superfamily hydrolase (TIGR01509 family)